MFLTALVTALSSCAHAPGFYPAPSQYVPSRPAAAATLLDMDDPGVGRYILQDVRDLQPGANFRLTGRNPRFKFALAGVRNQNFYLRFGIHPDMLRDTGPVTVTVRINGQELERLRVDTDAARDYTHPVPPALLGSGDPVIVELDVNPAWVSPWHETIGMLLISIGFYTGSA